MFRSYSHRNASFPVLLFLSQFALFWVDFLDDIFADDSTEVEKRHCRWEDLRRIRAWIVTQ